MTKSLKHLKFWCQPVLPLTYDDSLSYMETLSKTVSKVNEVIDYAESILESAMDYTDSEISALKTTLDAKIAALQSEMSVFKTEVYAYIDENQDEFEEEVRALFTAQKSAIDEEFSTLSTSVMNLVSTLSDTINTLETYVKTQDDDIRASIVNYHNQAIEYIDSQVEVLEQEIQAIVLESVTKVIDPCDLETKNLQDCIDNMYYNLRAWAFTARQYDMLGLTAAEFDEVGRSAYDYDYLGKWWWWQKPEIYKYIDALWEKMQKALEEVYKLIDERTITHSAWTGRKDKIINITDSAIMEIRVDALTAELYDSLNLSCTEYEAYKLTAYEYDWHGRSKLIQPDESEFSEFALLEYRAAYATNKILDMILASVESVNIENEVLNIQTQPFDSEPWDVQGIISDTVVRLGYQVYQNILAINQIIDKTQYQFKYNTDTETLDLTPFVIAKIPEEISVNFSVVAGQILAVRNALSKLSDYYTYLLSIQDEVLRVVGTQMVAEM